MRKKFLQRALTFSFTFSLIASWLGAVLEKKLELDDFFYKNQDGVVSRQFVTRNQEGHVVCVIVDDGSNEDPEDLTGVTVRRIERIQFLENKQEITRSYLDLETGEEVIIDRKSTCFDKQGNATEEQIGQHYLRLTQYDPYHLLQFDSAGHSLCAEKDATGNITQFLYENDPAFSEKLLLIEESHDRQVYSDDLGRELVIEWEEKGHKRRPIRWTGPSLPHCLSPPIKEISYDQFGNICRLSTQDGPEWSATFSALGALSSKEFKDGTSENWTTDESGKILSHTNREGIKESFFYDQEERVIKKEFFDRENDLIFFQDIQYCLSGIQSISDSRGIYTTIDYDHAGRAKKQTITDDQGNIIKQTDLQYGEGSEIYKVAELTNTSTQEQRHTFFERDSSRLIQAVRIEDSLQKIITRSSTKNESKFPITKTIDPQGFVHISVFQDHLQTELIIDPQGNIKEIKKFNLNEQLVQHTEFAYTPNTRTTIEHKLINGLSSDKYLTEEKYNEKGLLVQLTEDPGGTAQTERFTYNEWAQVTSITKNDGSSLFFTYDNQGNLCCRRSCSADIHDSFSYDHFGNIIAMENMHGKWVREFNSKGMLTHESSPDGFTTSTNYDCINRPLTLTLTDQSSIQYHYDSTNLCRIDRICPNGNLLWTHHYSLFGWDGRPLQETLPNELGTITYKWTGSSEQQHLLSGVQSPYWKQAATLSSKGLIEQVVTDDAFGNITEYFSHDSQKHLCKQIRVDDQEIQEKTYQYDSLHNRVLQDDYKNTINSSNQLLKNTLFQYEYDPRGNISKKWNHNHCWNFNYDSLDRLTSVVKDQKEQVCYTYDPLHRIYQETTSTLEKGQWREKERIYHIYQDDKNLGSVDRDGNLVHCQIIGTPRLAKQAGSAIAIECRVGKEKKTFYPIHDIFGSIRCLIDENGLIANTYRYDGFGNLYREQDPLIDNPWRYRNHRWNTLANISLIGRRAYEPETGLWITKDPLHSIDGLNRYAYVHGNPLHNSDPTGLWSVSSLISGSVDWLGGALHNAWKAFVGSIQHADYYILKDLSITNDYFSSVTNGYRSLLGKVQSVGFAPTESFSGVLGKGEVSDKVRITFINGILTEPRHLFRNLRWISESHGDNNIHYVYRATHGYSWDLHMCTATRALKYTPEQSYLLAEKWKALIEEMGGVESEGKIIHYAHSMGSNDSLAARYLLSEKEQSLIEIVTFGSPIVVPEDGFSSVNNYISMRDGVSQLFDPIGLVASSYYGSEHVTFLGEAFDDWPLKAHFIDSEIYQPILLQMGEDFVEKWGSVNETNL